MVQIDSGLLFGILAIVLPWAAYITKVTIDNQSKLKTSEANHESFKEEFDKTCAALTDSFKEMKTEVKGEITKVNNRMDIFLNREIDVLKNLLEK